MPRGARTPPYGVFSILSQPHWLTFWAIIRSSTVPVLDRILPAHQAFTTNLETLMSFPPEINSVLSGTNNVGQFCFESCFYRANCVLSLFLSNKIESLWKRICDLVLPVSYLFWKYQPNALITRHNIPMMAVSNKFLICTYISTP